MNRKDKESLTRVFKTLDVNGEGRLSRSEIKDGYRQLYSRAISDEEIDSLFQAVDTSHSGFIEYTEFIVAACNQADLLKQIRLDQAFKMFDIDSSGFISKQEMR